ncbi:hypothetical protein Tco_0595453 [Tanacetum coccineum]
MAEQQNPHQQPPQTPPLEHDQLELPDSPISFDLAPQVDFSPDLINIKPNNEVTTLYHEHDNSAYNLVDDLISKLKKKNREKVIPYIKFLSLLLEHKLQDYENYEATPIPTQIFNVNNWALKKNQPEGHLFTDHMLAFCIANEPGFGVSTVQGKKGSGVNNGGRKLKSINDSASSISGVSRSSVDGATDGTIIGEVDKPSMGHKKVTYHNMADFFCVLLTSIKDIDDLTRCVEAGAYEDVLGRLSKEEWNAIMDAIMALCGKLLDTTSDNEYSPKGITNYGHTHSASEWNTATPLETSAKTNQKFVGEFLADMSNLADNSFGRRSLLMWISVMFLILIFPSFRQILPLESDNVCDGVDLTIPKKVVEEGQSSFERCLIEVRVDTILKDSVTMGTPLPNCEGFTKEMVHVDYEWKPPCCDNCKIFGHVHDQCPKNSKGIPTVDKMNNDAGKVTWQLIKHTVSYESKAHGNLPKNGDPKASNSAKDDPSKKVHATKGGLHVPTSKHSVTTPNPYVVLDDMESEEKTEVVYDRTVILKGARTGASLSMARDGTNLNVLVEKTQFIRDGLGTVQIGIEAMDLDLLEDDQPFLVSSEDEEDIQTKALAKTKDTLVPQPSFPNDAAKVNLNKETNNPVKTTPEATIVIPPITTITTSLIIHTPLSFQSSFIFSLLNTTPQTEREQVRDKGKKARSHEEVVDELSKSNSDAEIRLTSTLEEPSKHKPLKKFTYGCVALCRFVGK